MNYQTMPIIDLMATVDDLRGRALTLSNPNRRNDSKEWRKADKVFNERCQEDFAGDFVIRAHESEPLSDDDPGFRFDELADAPWISATPVVFVGPYYFAVGNRMTYCLAGQYDDKREFLDSLGFAINPDDPEFWTNPYYTNGEVL